MWLVKDGNFTFRDTVNEVVYRYDEKCVSRTQVKGGHMAYDKYVEFPTGTAKYDAMVMMLRVIEDGKFINDNTAWRNVQFNAKRPLDEVSGIYLKYCPKTYRPDD
jgi:hypothetical protein